MNNISGPNKNAENQPSSQFTERGLYIQEDDQDWGSAGMNDIKQEPDTNQ